MKRTRVFTITALTGAILLSSAGYRGMRADGPGVLTVDDFAFVNTRSNTLIRYGMTWEEIEKSLGKPQSREMLGGESYGDIGVFYREGKAAALVVSYSTGRVVEYKTPRGIGHGGRMGDVEEKYGKGWVYDDRNTLYLLEQDGADLIPRHSPDQVREPGRTNALLFVFDRDPGYLSKTYVMDYQFARLLK